MALVLIAALALLAVAPAHAMSFKLGKTTAGLSVVVASGDIVRGDARRLARALERAERDGHGTRRLYLESAGGIVLEALKMAEIMRNVDVSTIVRKGKVCASACASILFVAGKYRTVEKGGMLAIHSCFDARSGRAASECNAIISAHAESVGVSGTTMMLLQEAARDDAVIVFDTDDAACFGLTRKPGARASRKTPKCMAEMTGQR
jgi:hypothetical protein